MCSRKLMVCVRTVVSGMAVAALWQLGACNLASNLIPPIDLNFPESQTEFVVTAGKPSGKQGPIHFSGVDVPVNLGGGSLGIDPESIRIEPDGSTGGKRGVAAQTAQDVQNCLDACALEQVDAARCAQVCEQGELHVTVWIGPADEIDASCDNGVRYEVRVRLDVDHHVDAVSVSPSSLDPATLDLLESGEDMGVCIQVLSPISGKVVIEAITLRVRL